MRTHFSSAVTLAVMFVFVSGTVGCQSNGGPWYNPKSYSWSNPLVKKGDAPSFASGAPANAKPSLDSTPNIDAPQGGYTDTRAGSYANRTAVADQSKPMNSGAPGAANPYSGYSVAETSSYPPVYAAEQAAAGGAAANQYQYPGSVPANQVANQQPSGTPGSSPYDNSGYSAGVQYQPTSATQSGITQTGVTGYPPYSQPSENNGTTDPYAVPASGQQTPNAGNYAPFGPASPQDPYAAPIQNQGVQQPGAAGGYYDQAPAQQPGSAAPAGTYPGQTSAYGGEVPSATPYQPYQTTSPTSGYGY